MARMGKIIRQFLRFSAVGITAFVLDYALLALFTEIFGINYLVSATLSFILATVFNYLASMKYVFTHKEGMKRTREFIIFTVISIIGLLLTNGGMILGVEVIHGHYLVVKIIVAAIVSVYSFVARKYFLDAKEEPQLNEGAAESSSSANAADSAGLSSANVVGGADLASAGPGSAGPTGSAAPSSANAAPSGAAPANAAPASAIPGSPGQANPTEI